MKTHVHATQKGEAPRACAVCGMTDARALVEARLSDPRAAAVVLCGTHALVHERSGKRARNVHELRALTVDRRERRRRAEELDELAASLTEAFAGERRGADRRVS